MGIWKHFPHIWEERKTCLVWYWSIEYLGEGRSATFTPPHLPSGLYTSTSARRSCISKISISICSSFLIPPHPHCSHQWAWPLDEHMKVLSHSNGHSGKIDCFGWSIQQQIQHYIIILINVFINITFLHVVSSAASGIQPWWHWSKQRAPAPRTARLQSTWAWWESTAWTIIYYEE